MDFDRFYLTVSSPNLHHRSLFIAYCQAFKLSFLDYHRQSFYYVIVLSVPYHSIGA